MNPFVQEQEELFAKTSSQIEGEFSDEAWHDHLEAWDYIKHQNELTHSSILKCHEILQKRLRPDIAGKFRDCDVMVGGHVCPNPVTAKYMLNDWIEKYGSMNFLEGVNELNEQETLIKNAHIEFEKIHPFEDGNGRVGRCLLNWHSMKAGNGLLIIHPGKEQQDYYKWFQ